MSAVSSASDSYEEHAAFAQERLVSDIPFEKGIILLGPEYLDEFYVRDDKEEHVVAPRVRIAPAEKAQSLGELIKGAPIALQTIYEATVFRKETKRPFVRVVGELKALEQSQLPLLPGDLVFMRQATKNDQSKTTE